ncbi:discoidin domain-containing protein [Paenibacillus whitsoniae]|uniref:Discoidin domain-containing protein n=1 Tax=Paenibacillus whitsoniae TaxID=2496558 RepID=A0A430JKR9_9BACL|nr:discoidin domain-containing protein [Paenibacillus whitsoniae]RTE11573.1 discoidin domain-containing protein [Paenibacillus whitsoniae]
MRIFRKTGLYLCAVTMLFSSALMAPTGTDLVRASGNEKLLSGNSLGALFPVSTQTIATGATYSWLTEGTHATDSLIVSTDNNGAPDMSDGINGPDGNYSNNSTWANNTVAFGTMIYDLKSVYKVTTVKVWADTATNSGMKRFEVLASLDGLTYAQAGTVENTNAANSGFAAVELSIKPTVYARYIKVIMHKDTPQYNMRLGEVAVFGDSLEPQALLSNNFLRSGGPYNTNTPRLPTNAVYQWATDQPFVTQGDLITTDNDAKNDGAGGVADLIDGSSTETSADMTVNSAWSSQGKYGTVIFNLNEIYQIGNIDVWTRADSTKYMDGYEVQLSTDGVNYTSLGYTANPNARTSSAIVNTVSSGVPGRNAKYVKIIMHNANDSQQLTVGEIAIWGWKLYDTSLSQTATPEQVEVRADLKNYSTLYLDWSSYNHVVNNVNKYAVYIETSDFTNASGLTAAMTLNPGTVGQLGKYTPYFALKPETTYYIAVTPFRSGSTERTDVTTLRITTPSVLGRAKAGDIFAVNDAPYGGGNYVNHGADEEANLTKKLKLLREIGGINKSRWWDHSSSMKTKYGSYGVNFHLFYHGSSYVAGDNNQGVWTFSSFNEPDLAGTAPSSAATTVMNNHSSMKAVDNRNLLVEPALAGVDAASLAWLDDFYNSDGQNGALVKSYFDVMDVHPYVKYADAAVPGLDQGTPEKLISKIADLKTVMSSHGDTGKPIVFTELGWSTYSGGGFLKKVDRATQRNYLARAYLHAIASGVSTVHWYNFQDDGTTASNLEHNLGLIDWNAVPKPSYYGYYTLVRVMKDAEYLGPVTGIGNPYYGYRFWDENKNRYVTSLWDASWQTTSTGNATAVLATSDAGVTVVGIDGSHKYLPAVAGSISIPLTGAPLFIYSSQSVSVTSVS